MKCPYCQSTENKVTDKRDTEEDMVIRRRRECLDCNKRFTTYERADMAPMYVLKKDGTKQPFNAEKLERGIIRSCQKRPVTVDQINKIVNEIELHLRNKKTVEIPSHLIGRMVMTRLKKLDKVSYIRFASVYKDFQEIEEFKEELDKLVK